MASDLPAPPTESGVYPEDRMKVSRWLTWKEADDGRKIPPYPLPQLEPARSVRFRARSDHLDGLRDRSGVGR
jgi:hypothetical protein